MIIDVSRYQGFINWDAVNGAIDGAIIQCGYGDDFVVQEDVYKRQGRKYAKDNRK